MSGSSIERLGVFFMALGQSREPGGPDGPYHSRR